MVRYFLAIPSAIRNTGITPWSSEAVFGSSRSNGGYLAAFGWSTRLISTLRFRELAHLARLAIEDRLAEHCAAADSRPPAGGRSPLSFEPFGDESDR